MDVEKFTKNTKPLRAETKTVVNLILIHNRITELISERLKPYDVSIQQFNVLRILKGQNGIAANLSTINERMITKMSNTTRLVDKLIAKEYVSRCVCTSNRRKIEIYITKKGEKSLIKMNVIVKKAEDLFLKDITKTDLEKLNLLLSKININN